MTTKVGDQHADDAKLEPLYLIFGTNKRKRKAPTDVANIRV